mmetsp:Transcript_2859/g.10917  ORF Transcript_2859/g.10917 Transcript_2859/m.10917 type:complete len:231 (-) Transcript_2859:766-1458(-)
MGLCLLWRMFHWCAARLLRSLFGNTAFLHGPIIAVVLYETPHFEKPLEQLSQIFVVWSVSESKGATVLDVLHKFVRNATAQCLDWCILLHVCHFSVLFLLCFCSHSLPWKRSLQEVYQNISEAFQIVPARLLVSHVGEYTGVSKSSCQRLSITERNMHASVFENFGKTKINEEHLAAVLPYSHQKIVGLNISVDNISRMQIFQSLDHLVSKHDYSFERELGVVFNKEFFQ